MTIEITSPEVEALILQHMTAGSFRNPEDLLRKLLRSPASPDTRTGADLIAAMRACPYPEVEIEASTGSLPARSGCHSLVAWLLDTNVLSELRKSGAERKILDFLTSTPLNELYVSIVTLAEIRYGIDLNPDAQKRAALLEWLTVKVRPMFDSRRTLPVNEDVILKWRRLMEDGRKIGHTFSQPDLLIAATAAHYGMTVVTRDRSHFDKARVPVFNPWD